LYAHTDRHIQTHSAGSKVHAYTWMNVYMLYSYKDVEELTFSNRHTLLCA